MLQVEEILVEASQVEEVLEEARQQLILTLMMEDL